MTDELEIPPTGDEGATTVAPDSASSTPVSRRAALKVIGAVPIAGALVGGAAFAQQGVPQAPTQRPRQTHEAPQQPAQGPDKNPPANAPKRHFFTAAEWRTVGVLADDIIPRDARSGSATDAGAPAFIDFNLSVPETSDEQRLAVRGGLAWLNRESRSRFRRSYAALNAAQRHQILDDIAWPDKAKPEFSHGVAFFSHFRDLVGMAFFSSSMGWNDLKYIGNVFNPNWQGCPEPAMQKLGVSFALMDTRIKPE